MITTNENQGQQQTQPDADAAALEAALQAGQELVRKHFRGVSDLHVERAVDPESGELFSEIRFDVPGREQDIQGAHMALTREWVESYPEPVRRFTPRHSGGNPFARIAQPPNKEKAALQRMPPRVRFD